MNHHSLPSQNKHSHEQTKAVESIGSRHLLHDTGNHRRLVLFADDEVETTLLTELAVVAIEQEEEKDAEDDE